MMTSMSFRGCFTTVFCLTLFLAATSRGQVLDLGTPPGNIDVLDVSGVPAGGEVLRARFQLPPHSSATLILSLATKQQVLAPGITLLVDSDAVFSTITQLAGDTGIADIFLPIPPAIPAGVFVAMQGCVGLANGPVVLTNGITILSQAEPFSPPPVPVVDVVSTATSQLSIQVTGRASAPGSSIRIEGGMSTVNGGAGGGSDGDEFVLTVPLIPDAVNHLFVIETDMDGLEGPPIPVSVVQDGTAPSLLIDAPVDEDEVVGPTTAVVGRVSDVLSGFDGLTVTVNGQTASVAIGPGDFATFMVPSIQIPSGGPVLITAVATDALGNTASRSVMVSRFVAPPTMPSLTLASGAGQSAPTTTTLPVPVAVQVSTAAGLPFADKLVTFEVVRSDGALGDSSSTVGDEKFLVVVTDGSGMARTFWRLGSDSGVGNNRLRITSNGVAGEILVCASATSRPATTIHVHQGNNQVGRTGTTVAEPLTVRVTDGQNGVAGIPVTFSVTAGSASLASSGLSTTVMTGSDGRAEVPVLLGLIEGVVRVVADFPGNAGNPVAFDIRSRTADASGVTSFSGLVLDNVGVPLGGVTCDLCVNGASFSQTTDIDGRFRFDGIPAGPATLHVDGATTTTRDGLPLAGDRYPSLEFTDIVLVPGIVNERVAPISLPRLLLVNDRFYDTMQPTLLEIDGVDGLTMTIEPGSMFLPDGAGGFEPAPDDTVVSLNRVQIDQIPMPLPDGTVAPLAWTLQPAGAVFTTPIAIEMPNMTGLPPVSTTTFVSFDHAIEEFVTIGTATVSADGSTIRTDEGSGITIAGWGGWTPPPPPPDDAMGCEDDPAVAALLAQLRASRDANWALAQQAFSQANMELGSIIGASGQPIWQSTGAALALLRTSWQTARATFSVLRFEFQLARALCSIALLEPTFFGEIACAAVSVATLGTGGLFVASVGGIVVSSTVLATQIDNYLNVAQGVALLTTALSFANAAAADAAAMGTVCAAVNVSDAVSAGIAALQARIQAAQQRIQEFSQRAQEIAAEIAAILQGVQEIRDTVQGWIDEINQLIDGLPQVGNLMAAPPSAPGMTTCVITLANGAQIPVMVPAGEKCDLGLIAGLSLDPALLSTNDAEAASIDASFKTAETSHAVAVPTVASLVEDGAFITSSLASLEGLTSFEGWTIMAAGRVVDIAPDGSFTLSNLPENELIRLTAVRTEPAPTLYAQSDFFVVTPGEPFVLPAPMMVSEEPPATPESLSLVPSGIIALAPSQTVALNTQAILSDGMATDVSTSSSGTRYSSSNPAVATVDETGQVSAHETGTVFVTAHNQGISTTKRIAVATDFVLTTIAGFVVRADGSPVFGAEVTSIFGGQAFSDVDGAFTLSLSSIPFASTMLGLTATALLDGVATMGTSIVTVVPGDVSDGGAIILGADLIVNGGFETGDFTGWTTVLSGAGSIVINDGTLDPNGPDGPLPPCDGSVGAVTFQSGPSINTLYQDVTIPAGASMATLSWLDRIRNHAANFSDPNQEFRVEIRDLSDNLLAELFSTNPGDPLLNECIARSADVTAFAGQTVRITFMQQDDLFFFNVHLDRVSLVVQ